MHLNFQKLEKDEGIYILNEKNYDEGPKQFKYLLVYFYAPWCGHCKAFGPGESFCLFDIHSLLKLTTF